MRWRPRQDVQSAMSTAMTMNTAPSDPANLGRSPDAVRRPGWCELASRAAATARSGTAVPTANAAVRNDRCQPDPAPLPRQR